MGSVGRLKSKHLEHNNDKIMSVSWCFLITLGLSLSIFLGSNNPSIFVQALPSYHPQVSDCVQEGFFRYPNDCKRFYRCVDWDHDGRDFSIFHFLCPVGTVFDEGIQICNHPRLAPPCDENDNNTSNNDQNGSSSSGSIIGIVDQSGQGNRPVIQGDGSTNGQNRPISQGDGSNNGQDRPSSGTSGSIGQNKPFQGGSNQPIQGDGVNNPDGQNRPIQSGSNGGQISQEGGQNRPSQGDGTNGSNQKIGGNGSSTSGSGQNNG